MYNRVEVDVTDQYFKLPKKQISLPVSWIF
jgi:hypothetical protein